jgi:hypothetical protein
MASIATFRKASLDPAVTVGQGSRALDVRHMEVINTRLATSIPGVKKMVIKSTLHVEVPRLDYLTWFFEREIVKPKNEELFIDAEHPENVITREDAKTYAQQIARTLRDVEGIGAEGPGKDVIAMYSTNQVLSSRFYILIQDDVSGCHARCHRGRWSLGADSLQFNLDRSVSTFWNCDAEACVLLGGSTCVHARCVRQGRYSTIKNIPRNILTPRYHQWGNKKELAWAIPSTLVSCDGSRTTETDSYFLALHIRDHRVAQVSSQYFGLVVGLWSIRATTSSRTLKACIIWASKNGNFNPDMCASMPYIFLSNLPLSHGTVRSLEVY